MTNGPETEGSHDPVSHAPYKDETFRWRVVEGSGGGWTIRTRRSPVHNNDSNSLKWKSHLVWKNELHLTKFANQDLPEALWGSNVMELHHEPTATTIYAGALEALRSWALLDAPPIPHASGNVPDPWDYTFTTPYAGSVCRWDGHGTRNRRRIITDEMLQPDGSSLYREPAPADHGGKFNTAVQLRPPLCKCVGGRMLCAGVMKSMDQQKKQQQNNRPIPSNSNNNKENNQLLDDKGGSTTASTTNPMNTTRQSSTHVPPSPPLLPVESWEPSDEVFDMKPLLFSGTNTTNPSNAPTILYYSQPLYLWVQNLDPQSYSFLMGHVVATPEFLVASLRCFVRVNGVRVRLVGTQWIVRRSSPHVVLRERSWREGTWAAYMGSEADPKNASWAHVDLGTDLEQIERASKRLPHKYPPVVEKLVLPNTNTTTATATSPTTDPSSSSTPLSTATPTPTRTTLVWTKNIGTTTNADDSLDDDAEGITGCYCRSSITSSSGGIILLVENRVVALDSHSGATLWERNLECLEDGAGSEKDLPGRTTSARTRTTRPLSLLSVAQSPVDGTVLVGDDRGGVHVLKWPDAGSTDEAHDPGGSGGIGSGATRPPENWRSSYRFRTRSKKSSGRNARAQTSSSWVERVAWSDDGRYFAAAAGKMVMVNGEILEMEGTAYDICFLKGDAQSPQGQQLAVAIYGTLVLVGLGRAADGGGAPSVGTTTRQNFQIGASAVLACAVPSDGKSIAIGCLDKRVRTFRRRAARNRHDDDGREDERPSSWSDGEDWVGFDGRISRLSWSSDNRYLAALGGSILLVVPVGLKPGEAPILCASGPRNSTGTRSGEGRFQTFSWVDDDTLLARTDRFLHVFDIRATNDTVPKKCHPTESVPIDKGDYFVATNKGDEILIWGGSNVKKIKLRR